MIIGIALLALIAGGVGVALGRRGGSDSDNEE
jgi:hypothetical protein